MLLYYLHFASWKSCVGSGYMLECEKIVVTLNLHSRYHKKSSMITNTYLLIESKPNENC